MGGIDALCPYRQPCFLLKEITRNYLENNCNDIEDDSPALSEKGWLGNSSPFCVSLLRCCGTDWVAQSGEISSADEIIFVRS